MIRTLSVQNYALIESLDIEFQSNFNIITGETGAGKSILMGALSLLLGNRADVAILNNKQDKCIVEAVFDIENYNLKEFFVQNCEGIDYENQTIIRRIINPNGKSRAFVNDSPVNLSILKKLSTRLLDIHSQHQNLMLSDNLFQLKVVDSVAKHDSTIDKYKINYSLYTKKKTEYQKIIKEAEQAKADYDYYCHRFEQLENAVLIEGEQEELEAENQTLNHAEEIKMNLDSVSSLLSGEGENILSKLNEAEKLLSQITNYNKQAGEIAERINSTYIELKDIASETDYLGNDIEYNPTRAEFITQRLDLIYSLLQQHKVDTVEELITIKNDLEQKILSVDSFEFQIEQAEKELNKIKIELEKQSKILSKNRQKVIPIIEKKIKEQLFDLGMPNAIFKVEIQEIDFTSLGKDRINFLFMANKQGDLQDINKVASGGEISRVMLTIKALIAENSSLPSIIFDEIDTGVSGDIADKMGEIMKKMSKKMQVFSITHLPQVAAKADAHYLVYKQDKDEKTFSSIKKLGEKDRILQIAKMLSGKDLTFAAMQNAQILIKNEN